MSESIRVVLDQDLPLLLIFWEILYEFDASILVIHSLADVSPPNSRGSHHKASQTVCSMTRKYYYPPIKTKGYYRPNLGETLTNSGNCRKSCQNPERFGKIYGKLGCPLYSQSSLVYCFTLWEAFTWLLARLGTLRLVGENDNLVKKFLSPM